MANQGAVRDGLMKDNVNGYLSLNDCWGLVGSRLRFKSFEAVRSAVYTRAYGDAMAGRISWYYYYRILDYIESYGYWN